MRFILFLVVLVCAPAFSYSQVSSCSELSNLISTLKNPDREASAADALMRGEALLGKHNCADSLEFMLRLSMVDICFNTGRFPKVIALTDSLDIAQFQGEHKVYLMELLSRRANAFSYQVQHSEALDLANQTLHLSESLDSVKYFKLLTNKGVMLGRAGMYNEALALYEQALSHFKKVGDKGAIAIMYNNIAEVYRERFEDYPRALKMYKNAARVNAAVNNAYHEAKNYNNIGICFDKETGSDSALFYYNKALVINEKLGNIMGIIKTRYNMGVFYHDRGKYDKARYYYTKNLEKSKEINFKPGLYFNYMGLAAVETKVGNYEKSLALIALGEGLFEKGSTMEMKEVYMASKIANLKGLKRFEEALAIVETFDQEEDSINAFKTEQTTLMLRAEHEAELDAVEKKRLVDAHTATKEILKKERIWNSFYLGFGIVVVVLLVITVVFYTQKKRAYNKQQSLMHTINHQNKSLEEAQEALAAQLEMKTKILSVLGHDLRAPFASISGLLNVMSSDLLSIEDAKPLVKQLSTEVEQTLTTLSNILTWSRLQLGSSGIQKEVVPLCAMMKQALEAAVPAANAKEIEVRLECDEEVQLLADPNQLRSILSNLLNNAIKFSEVKGKVALRYKAALDMHVISVIDEGVGLSKKALDSLNNRQNYTSKGTAGEKGTGIGLSLVRDFIALHQGELLYYNNSPKGTVVEIRLPRSSKA